MILGASWHLERVRAGEAWAVVRGRGATIAVIDDGVDVRHPEFEGRVRHPLNVRTGDGAVLARGFEPHGTKVAGVVAAGGVRVSGIAPEALLLPVRLPSVREHVGSPEEGAAILHAVSHGADVICCAWGPTRERLGRSPLPDATRRAVEHAVTEGREGRGCVVVFAAGNEGAPLSLNEYAAHPAVIAAGACNDVDRRPRYSNFGPELFCVFPSSDPSGPRPDHRAIQSTTPVGPLSLGETWYTERFGLTSAACAGVAGVCALIVSANPRLTGREVRDVLRDACVKISPDDAAYDETGHSRWYGYGRPDALTAVRLAKARA